jgi:site-specific recombinase XerD
MADYDWSLDGMKFLDLDDVERLRKLAAKVRREGVRTRRFRLVRNWFIIEVGLQTGLRVMEIAALQCGDLLMEQASPEVIVRCGKGGRRRVVKVSQSFKIQCRWFLDAKKRAGQTVTPDAPVFVARRTGLPLCRRQIQKVFERMSRDAQLSKHVSIHSTRHSYATALYKASGRNLRLVQKQLGHSRITTTQVYADVFAEDAVAAVERLYRA